MAEEIYGYVGKILRVDLTTKEVTEEPIDPYLPYLGARGWVAKMFWDEIPREVGAFDPENRIIIAAGPINGTGALGSGRCDCGTKSPLMYPKQSFTTASAGYIGPELKHAGYDALIVQGKAEHPVYLWINNGKVEIRNAREFWTQSTTQTRQGIKQKHDKDTVVACIGPAGENLVLYSVVTTECNSAFGKGGFGAVMGSKNLKAVAVRGTGRVNVADPNKLLEVNSNRLRFHSLKVGETREVAGKTIVGLEPKASKFASFSDTKLGDEVKQGRAQISIGGCPTCPWNCRAKVKWADNSIRSGSAECMEIYAMLGQEMGYYGGKLFGKPGWDLAMLVDDLGIGFEVFNFLVRGMLIKASKAGILTEENTGLPWGEYGSQEFYRKYLHIITYREGFGDIIAQGPWPMTNYIMEHEEFGPDRAQMEVLCKEEWGCANAGQFGAIEFDHGRHQPNSLRAIWAVTDDQFSSEPEPWWNGDPRIAPGGIDSSVMIKWLGTDKVKDLYYFGPETAKAVIAHQDISAVTDSLQLCCILDTSSYSLMSAALPGRGYMVNRLIEWEELVKSSPNGGSEYLSAIFGRNVTWDELAKQGERIMNLIRAIWVRDGYTEGPHDTYWDEIFEERDSEDRLITPKDEFEQTMQDYYQQRGWKDGVPTRAKLEELDLKDVADELEALGKLPA